MTAQETVRMALLCGGYSPIPCEGKRPVLKAWEKRVATNADEIALWSKVYARAENTGILTPRVPTLDADILNEDAARALEDMVRERYEESGYVLTRIGRAPKRAFLFRTEEPFKKIAIDFVARNGGAAEKLEFLGDGQQVVVFGTHPETCKPYLWFGGEPGAIKREDLPYIREAEARELIERAAELLAAEHGYVRADERPRQRKSTAGEDTAHHGPVDRAKIKAALAVIDSDCSYEIWRNVGGALHHALGESGFELFATWSAKATAKYNAVECRERWRGIRSLRDHTAGTIFHLADQADPGWRDRYDSAGHQQTNDKPLELVPINLAQYDTEEIPPREWGVPDRFPRRNVALLSGHGGAGKSLTLQQLAVAHVLGKDWLRSLPERGAVLLVNCEDDEGELVRRLQPILAHYRASYSDVAADLHVFSLVERDDATGQLLATVGRDGIVRATPLYNALLAKAGEVKPICIVIDNVADVFGGNEIDRSQVRQFVRLMRRLAIAADGYVIMSAHPSLQGISSKSGLSGSTQWHNSVRARAYLRGPSDKENDEGPSSDVRVLEFMKSNYSALAEQITLRWANGLYLPAPTPSAPEAAAANNVADTLFLELLDQHTRLGDNVSPKSRSNNYAPTVFAKTREAKAAGIGKEAFAAALARLIEAGRVCLEPYGPPSDDTKRLARRETSMSALHASSTHPPRTLSTAPPYTPHACVEGGGPACAGDMGDGVEFRVIGPAPGATCVCCNRTDASVMKVRPAIAGAKTEPLHADCAARWFSGGSA